MNPAWNRLSWSRLYYAARGWTLAGIFAILAWARYRSDAELRLEGLALVAASAAYRLYAARFIREHSNGSRLASGTPASHGPYRWGRHPLYLANMTAALGLLVFANCLSAWAAAVFLTAVFLHHSLLAKTEEDFLAVEWGGDYASYRRRTPRWFGLPNDEGAGEGAPGATLAVAWKRQAANLGKTAACVAILWVLASV